MQRSRRNDDERRPPVKWTSSIPSIMFSVKTARSRHGEVSPLVAWGSRSFAVAVSGRSPQPTPSTQAPGARLCPTPPKFCFLAEGTLQFMQ